MSLRTLWLLRCEAIELVATLCKQCGNEGVNNAKTFLSHLVAEGIGFRYS
jgi:hypothetical protein